jgi:type IV secretion system protein VirD4
MALSEFTSRRGLGIALGALTAAVLIWLCVLYLLGQAAAVMASHHTMPIGVLDMLPVSLQLPEHWTEPALAWPPDVQAQLPGPGGFYLVAVVILLVLLLAVVGVMALVGEVKSDGGSSRRKPGKGERPIATWSTRRDVRDLRPSGEGARLVLG